MNAQASPIKALRRRPARGKDDLGKLRKPFPVWAVTLAAFLFPGAGQWLNGNPQRGLTMQFFMLLFGFITWQIAPDGVSVIGRLAGGIAVYVFMVIDANGIAKRRVAAWGRIEAGEPPRRPR